MSTSKSIALLALPVWGWIGLLWIISLVPGASSLSGTWAILSAALLVLLGSSPIFLSATIGPFSKSLAVAAYVAVSAVFMFIAGWAAVGLFGIASSP